MLKIESLSKSFGKPIFENATLVVPSGVGAVISAPNGSGKSTLLKMIVGVLAPDSGRILLNGQPTAERRARLGYCPSGSAGFYPRLTLRQNLHYFGALRGLRRANVDRWIEANDFFRIDYWNEPAEKVSEGMLQKARILRTFLHEPDFVLLDEPLANLDVGSRDALARWLRDGRPEGRRPGYLVAQHGPGLPGHPWTIRERQLLEARA